MVQVTDQQACLVIILGGMLVVEVIVTQGEHLGEGAVTIAKEEIPVLVLVLIIENINDPVTVKVTRSDIPLVVEVSSRTHITV